MTTGDGAGGAAPSNNPCTGREVAGFGETGAFGFLAAIRPQLSVCFAAPCSLANHRPHSRAQGVAPQASQLRKGITSGEGMVSSRVQIWQLTVWGKGFERQASAMVRSPLFWFFQGSARRSAQVCGRKLSGSLRSLGEAGGSWGGCLCM